MQLSNREDFPPYPHTLTAFYQLKQKPSQRGWVHEGDFCAVCPRSWRAAGQPQPGPRGPPNRGRDVGHAKGKMMDPLSPLIKKPAQRPPGGEWLDELELGRPHRDERHRRVLPGHRGPVPDGEAEGGGRNGRLSVELPDDDGQVRETRGAGHTTADGR
jgi:hypothetical protein